MGTFSQALSALGQRLGAERRDPALTRSPWSRHGHAVDHPTAVGIPLLSPKKWAFNASKLWNAGIGTKEVALRKAHGGSSSRSVKVSRH